MARGRELVIAGPGFTWGFGPRGVDRLEEVAWDSWRHRSEKPLEHSKEGSSREAWPVVHPPAARQSLSDASKFGPGPLPAEGHRRDSCWRILPEGQTCLDRSVALPCPQNGIQILSLVL